MTDEPYGARRPPTEDWAALWPDLVPERRPQTQIKDGRTWLIGADEEVAWINDGVSEGRSITASIPPIFTAYATLAFPLELGSTRDRVRGAEDRLDDALLRVLCAHTEAQWWWLGFLDTGASDVVFEDAPRVRMYSGWTTSWSKPARMRSVPGTAIRVAGSPRCPS